MCSQLSQRPYSAVSLLDKTGDVDDSYSIQRAVATGMIVSDMPMRKTELSLLPLREKISPAFVANRRQWVDGDMELSDGLGRRGRLFSVSSSPSGRSSRCGRLSERSSSPPFTPQNVESNENEKGTRAFLRRRPSEHYLEVLGDYKGTRTLPKISPPTCLPPLGRTRHDDKLPKAFNNNNNQECVLEGNISSGRNRNMLAHDHDTTQLFRISDVRKENIPLRLPANKVLRKANSLPIIRPCNTVFTFCEDKLNLSAFPNRTNAPGNENDNVITAVEEDFVEQQCDESQDVNKPEEKALETFDRICHWLKECENANLENGSFTSAPN